MAKREKILAQLGDEVITYDDIETDREEDRPGRKYVQDTLSEMLRATIYMEGKYEDWFMVNGERIRFTRFYPQKKLYVDIFETDVAKDQIQFRKELVEKHGFKYLPIEYGKSVTTEDVTQVLKGK